MSRPICACCGKPYGERCTTTQHVVVEIGQPIPPYKGNLKVISETFEPPLPPKGPKTPDEASSFAPMDPFPTWASGGPRTYTGRKGRSITRTLWDGETYSTPAKPFCTKRCAFDFAQLAYRAGFRIQK